MRHDVAFKFDDDLEIFFFAYVIYWITLSIWFYEC